MVVNFTKKILQNSIALLEFKLIIKEIVVEDMIKGIWRLMKEDECKKKKMDERKWVTVF